MVSNVLAWVGLAPLSSNAPTAPVESPALWAVCAWCRRQNGRSSLGPTISSTPIQNSQTIDGLLTGDLTAAGDQGDRQAVADPSITALSAPLTVDVASATTTSTTFAQVKAAAPRTTRDTKPPTVSLTGLAAGATVSGTVNLTATASDDVGVTKVQFMDGTQLLAEDPNSPYSATWNTTTVANGTHTLTARAFDAAGYTKTSTSVTVTVNNADTTKPTVSLTGPAAGATVSGTVNLTATASDNVGVTKVQFMDGTQLLAEDPNSPYSTSWNTTTAANGSHTLTARAFDAAGNTTTSQTVTVTVNNAPDTTAPTVSFTGPTEGATVSGRVNLTATASDNVGVTKVQFFWGRPSGVAVNLELLAEDATAPYGPVSWDSAAAANGPNMLFVRAFDAAGNTATKSINVVVNNSANNLAPVVPGKTIPRTFDPVSGAVTGVMNVQDPEQAQLSYTLAYPRAGAAR